MGNAPSTLTVLPIRTVMMAGMPMGNISDHKPLVNIAPFGLCRSLANPVVAAATAANHGRLQPMPCIPNTQTPWFPGKPDTLIKGQPALLKSCKCMCLWAGTISITDDGQHGVGCMDVMKQPRISKSPAPFVHKDLPKMTDLSKSQ